jgi:ribosomal protein S18 acetylase RimI-like enzyme
LSEIVVRDADLAHARDASAIVTILDSYAFDAVGGFEGLSPAVRERLIPALQQLSTTLVLLAFVEGAPVGVAVCFFGFSTFKAQPLLNIHDLAVLPEHRGRGVGRALLTAAEDRALRSGCCRLTLEVQEDNPRARALYDKFGFEDVVVRALPTRFLAKPLKE